jgi:hypothetical protein
VNAVAKNSEVGNIDAALCEVIPISAEAVELLAAEIGIDSVRDRRDFQPRLRDALTTVLGDRV